MSYYKMCDVSGVSLDGLECAAFFIVPNQPNIYNIPFFGRYDERSGKYTLKNKTEQHLFDLIINEYLTESELKDLSSEIDIGNLLKYPMRINRDIYMFVVQKDIYESLTTVDVDFSYRMKYSILDGIHSVVNIEKDSYQLNKKMLEMMNYEDVPDKERSEYENKFSKEMTAKFESYDDFDIDLIFDIFDLIRKEDKPFNISVVSFIDQYAINLLFSSQLTSKEVINRFTQMLSFRSAIKIMNPTLKPFADKINHQGVDDDFYFSFYKKLTEGLGKIIE